MQSSKWFALLVAMSGVCVAFSPAGLAASHHHVTARHSPVPARTENAKPNEDILKAEVLLDRAGFSPGVIDARDGDNFDNALHVFQQTNGLTVGTLDQQTMERLAQLSDTPVLAQYTIQPEDVNGPFAPKIPQDFTKMARLPSLAYHSPRQLLAEKFHMSEGLLQSLNPKANFSQAGTVITVGNVAPMPEDPKLAARKGEGSGSGTEQRMTVSRVVVDKPHHAVLVYGADNRLLAFYPASIGSAEKPAPSGRFVVRSVDYDPTYTYNPAYAFRGQHAQRKITVMPGPNNPVGLVWIGLSAKGYGIHGTPDPDAVGKTQSHGCVRLTNWDALSLGKLVRRGTPVDFVG